MRKKIDCCFLSEFLIDFLPVFLIDFLSPYYCYVSMEKEMSLCTLVCDWLYSLSLSKPLSWNHERMVFGDFLVCLCCQERRSMEEELP